MSNSTAVPTETLKCAACGTDFDRERKRGVKPKNCPSCTQRLADEAKEAAAAEERSQKLHCESCDQDWERPAQRGKPPKKCPSCSGFRHVIPASNGTSAPTPLPVQASSFYTLARLHGQYNRIPTEDQFKFSYIESQLRSGQRDDESQTALKSTWTRLENSLKRAEAKS